MGIEGGMFGMGDEEMNRMLETHPLTVFSKLAYGDPGNKVYQKCLENEILEAARSLSENLSDDRIRFVERIIGMFPEKIERDPDDPETRDIAMRMEVIRRIFAEIRRIRGE